jgi:ligand-binding sensor domain-containing protein
MSVPVDALQTERGAAPYLHTVWQTDEGLPQNSVTAIVQTRDGYLWLATQEGLARFDGTRFTVFDKRNTPPLRENNIQALYEGRDGALWIGTEGGGIAHLKDHRFTSYSTADGLGDNIVDAICEDLDGNLWVGTLAGLSRFNSWRAPTAGSSLSHTASARHTVCK